MTSAPLALVSLHHRHTLHPTRLAYEESAALPHLGDEAVPFWRLMHGLLGLQDDAPQPRQMQRLGPIRNPIIWVKKPALSAGHFARVATGPVEHYSFVTRSRNALPTTLTEDSAMAAAAMIGDSSIPNVG